MAVSPAYRGESAPESMVPEQARAEGSSDRTMEQRECNVLQRDAHSGGALSSSVCQWVAQLTAKEICWVQKVSGWSRRASMQSFNIAVNRLGNGWLYLLIALMLLILDGWNALRFIVLVSLVVGCTFLVYGLLKCCLRRPRPYDIDSNLLGSVKALDRYSFPSGHCMTLTTVGILVGVTHHSLIAFMGILLLAMGWASLSLGHHFVSDIIGGIVIGALMACLIVFLVS